MPHVDLTLRDQRVALLGEAAMGLYLRLLTCPGDVPAGLSFDMHAAACRPIPKRAASSAALGSSERVVSKVLGRKTLRKDGRARPKK